MLLSVLFMVPPILISSPTVPSKLWSSFIFRHEFLNPRNFIAVYLGPVSQCGDYLQEAHTSSVQCNLRELIWVPSQLDGCEVLEQEEKSKGKQHMGYSQNYGPPLVVDYITAPNIWGAKMGPSFWGDTLKNPGFHFILHVLCHLNLH